VYQLDKPQCTVNAPLIFLWGAIAVQGKGLSVAALAGCKYLTL